MRTLALSLAFATYGYIFACGCAYAYHLSASITDAAAQFGTFLAKLS